MMAQPARTMVSPEQLRQYREDCDTVEAGRETAKLFLDAARRRATDAKTMKRTRLAALEVARALHRMHVTKSYEDQHNNWSALCRHLRINRRDSYELMNMLEVLQGLPADTLAKLDQGLSRRQFRVLSATDPDDRAELLNEAQAEGDTTPAALERLRQQLRSAASDGAPRIEAEAARQAKPERAPGLIQAARRHLTMLRDLCAKLTTADRCAAALDQLDAAISAGHPSEPVSA